MADNVFKPRRGSAKRIREINPILEDGEIVFVYPEDGSTRGPKGIMKIGDGVTPYNNLPSFLEEGDFVDKNKDVGKPFGVAPLNSRNLIDPMYLPTEVDNVEVYSQKNQFPNIGLPNKIYIAASEEYNNQYRWNEELEAYEKSQKALTYSIEKDGSSIKLKGADGSSTSVDNVGGVEIRDTNPSPEELYPGKMWIIRS